MCDHSHDPGGREAAMIVLDPGTPERHGRDGVWCDPCLAPMVKALNDGGIRTKASCCGHGRRPGSIILADERWLFIMPDFESAQALDALMPYPGINDEPHTNGPFPLLDERYDAARNANLGDQLTPSERTERVRIELDNAFSAGALWQHRRPV